ncbi:polyprenyl synthetase family protein [Streptomyces virginiae]|uniref:polyprenyl synthetase family protein n=1 Tax=Streptomyces virginiae TaxID=1961 RepID=UPI003325CA8F
MEIAETLRAFLFAGGKRLRPQLCVIGWQTAGEGPVPAPVVQAAASLEMFHAFALIHDDVMDDSASRRGHATVHRSLAAHHASRPDAARLGVNAAILLGDLALAWSDALLHTAGLTPTQLTAAHEVVDAMRTELMYGQYLDLCATGQVCDDVEAALRTARYKTARYTVERPLLLGAALAGAGHGVHEALSAYALPVGEAFQLRDDLLGVFGTPQVTGKPSLDDLRDGKHTVLAALALKRATPRQRNILHTLLGDPCLDETGADRIRQVLAATGARDEVENMINTRRAQALRVLASAPFPASATAGLRQLTDAAMARTS